MTQTPPELHRALIRADGAVDLLSDDELAEIGVTREHAESYARFLAAFTPSTGNPLAASGDDLTSYDYWRRKYDEHGAESYDFPEGPSETES